jgi:hypothetical protein
LYEGKFCLSDIKLYLINAGEMMRVYGHPAKEQINASLLNVAADGPARLKFSGFVSTNSEENMCTVCDKPFSSLVDPSCYDPTSKFFFFQIASMAEYI